MTPPKPPRLSLEGLRVRKLPHDPSRGRLPEVALRLTKRDYPAEGLDPFSPLRIPEHLEAELRDVDSILLDKLQAEFDAHLQPGSHVFPVAGRRGLEVEVLEGTTAWTRLEVGKPDPIEPTSGLLKLLASPRKPSPSGFPAIVRSLELVFSQPLILRNVFQLLMEVRDLFSDRGVAGVLQASLAATEELAPRLQRFLAFAGSLADQVDRLGDVHLRRVRAVPVWRAWSGQWELRFHFSGHVHISGRIPWAFDEVVLPAFILPVPYASIDELLSDRPLATASFHGELVRWDEIARAAWKTLRSYDGKFALDSHTPEVSVHLAAVDQTEIDARVRLPERLTASGRIRGSAEGEALLASADDVAIGFPGPSVHVGIKARIEDHGPSHAPLLSRLRVDLENTLHPGSELPSATIELHASHPLAQGATDACYELERVRIHEGSGGLSLAGRTVELWPMTRRVAFSCDAHTSRDFVTQEVGLRSALRLDSGHLEGFVELGADAAWHVGVDGSFRSVVEIAKEVPDIPELSIDSGTIRVRLEGDSELSLATRAEVLPTNAFELTLRNARFATKLDGVELTLHDRRLTFPAGTELTVASRRGTVTATGFEELAFDVRWDLHGEPCLLHAGDRSASLLAEDLRSGEITAHLGGEGRLSFSGQRDGLYGIRYFNALLNPMADPAHVLEILGSEEALSHVFSALELISPKLSETTSMLHDLGLGLRTIAQRIGLRALKDLIPRENLARVVSIALAGDTSVAARLSTQIQRVTEARGLDVQEVKSILRVFFDEFDADYEIAGVVKWLDGLVCPLGPLPRETAVPLEPLAVHHADRLQGLPSAAEIYERIDQGRVDAAFTATLCRLAVMLTENQLEYVLSHADGAWTTKHVQWLRYVHAVKRRVNRIAQAYGGIEHALQGFVIALFLGEAVSSPLDPTTLSDEAWSYAAQWPPACALGPEEVATLLKAGLALDRQARQNQINNRMLLDLVARRSVDFLLQVLAEIGADNPNALSGVLFAFLDQEQDHLVEPLDLPSLLESKLGMLVPRRGDFMAGGRCAADSYYEALAALADAVMERSHEHLARKNHLQVQRHEVPSTYRSCKKDRPLVDAAREAIERADEAGEKSLHIRSAKARAKAVEAYRHAFKRCAELLAVDRLAFQAPWLRDFWGRNEEALRALSVVRNYQEDIDRVRDWLHTRSGESRFESEQHLLETVVRTLIHQPADRKRLLADPLVRLLIDPDPGTYDFVVVSCMGVITEGDVGTELSEPYRRLWERRGVRVLRAPTGTAMSLEENARRIIDIFKLIEGPFGYVGYSQGCANGLLAESILRGSTPDDQRILERLVSRNLLFSAFNGSALGTFGSEKFLRATIDGERFLKHYQVMFSSEAVGAFLRTVKAVLDSSMFVRILGGVHSLTPARARDFHREIQVVEHAPTSTMRGVIDEGALPEALEFTWYLLRHMTGSEDMDTQVLAEDAVGHSTRVVNDMSRLLQRCDIPTARQAIHHWSPLFEEVKFVTTGRDRERRVYDSPKDRHVFPWVEVNARFGLIARAKGQ